MVKIFWQHLWACVETFLLSGMLLIFIFTQKLNLMNVFIFINMFNSIILQLSEIKPYLHVFFFRYIINVCKFIYQFSICVTPIDFSFLLGFAWLINSFFYMSGKNDVQNNLMVEINQMLGIINYWVVFRWSRRAIYV